MSLWLFSLSESEITRVYNKIQQQWKKGTSGDPGMIIQETGY